MTAAPRNSTHRRSAPTGQPLTGRGEQAVLVRHQADEQKPGDEDERRPVLGGRRAGSRRLKRSRRRQSDKPDAGQRPTGEMLTAAARFKGHGLIHALGVGHPNSAGLMLAFSR